MCRAKGRRMSSWRRAGGALPAGPAGDALLIECGWGSWWAEPEYVTGSPAFTSTACRGSAQPFALLGVDVPVHRDCPFAARRHEAAGNMLVPIFRAGCPAARAAGEPGPDPDAARPADCAAAEYPGGQRRAVPRCSSKEKNDGIEKKPREINLNGETGVKKTAQKKKNTTGGL